MPSVATIGTLVMPRINELQFGYCQSGMDHGGRFAHHDISGLFLGLWIGWIPALILALLVAVATIFLWPLAAVAVLYVIYRVFGVHPKLLTYIAAFVGIIAI